MSAFDATQFMVRDYLRHHDISQETRDEADAAIRLLEAFNNLDRTTWFWKNCRAQRKRGAKICQVCPFRPFIESLPEGGK